MLHYVQAVDGIYFAIVQPMQLTRTYDSSTCKEPSPNDSHIESISRPARFTLLETGP